MTLENVFRVGDRVWHPLYGWSTLEYINSTVPTIKLVNGYFIRELHKDHLKLLSFTEYDINPDQRMIFRIGDVVIDVDDYMTIYMGEDEDGAILFNTFYYNGELVTKDKISFGLGFTKSYTLASDYQKELFYQVLKQNNLKWNPVTKSLEKINTSRVGDDVIVWDNNRLSGARIIRKSEHTEKVWDNCILWDGTKEQFDNVRKGKL